MILETNISPELYAMLPQCEAVAIRYYRRDDWTEFATAYAAGTTEEMNGIVNTPRLLLQFPGLEILGDTVVPVSELMPPDEEVTP